MLNSIPSDNLYKFICGLGIALIFASYVSGPLLLKSSVETYALAVTLSSGVDSAGLSQVKDSVLTATSVRQQHLSDYQFLRNHVVEPIRSYIELQITFRWIVLTLGACMMIGGVLAWYFLTQRFADRASRNAGSTQMILDRKVELSNEIGPILTKVIDAFSPAEEVSERHWPTETLIGEVQKLRQIRGRYGSVMKRKPLKTLERLIDFGSWAATDPFDYESVDPDNHREIRRATFEKRANDVGLEGLARSLRLMVEKEVREFLP